MYLQRKNCIRTEILRSLPLPWVLFSSFRLLYWKCTLNKRKVLEWNKKKSLPFERWNWCRWLNAIAFACRFACFKRCTQITAIIRWYACVIVSRGVFAASTNSIWLDQFYWQHGTSLHSLFTIPRPCNAFMHSARKKIQWKRKFQFDCIIRIRSEWTKKNLQIKWHAMRVFFSSPQIFIGQKKKCDQIVWLCRAFFCQLIEWMSHCSFRFQPHFEDHNWKLPLRKKKNFWGTPKWIYSNLMASSVL